MGGDSPTTLRLTLTERKFVLLGGFVAKLPVRTSPSRANDAKWTPFGECACSTSVHERAVAGSAEYQRLPRPSMTGKVIRTS